MCHCLVKYTWSSVLGKKNRDMCHKYPADSQRWLQINFFFHATGSTAGVRDKTRHKIFSKDTRSWTSMLVWRTSTLLGFVTKWIIGRTTDHHSLMRLSLRLLPLPWIFSYIFVRVLAYHWATEDTRGPSPCFESHLMHDACIGTNNIVRVLSVPPLINFVCMAKHMVSNASLFYSPVSKYLLLLVCVYNIYILK